MKPSNKNISTRQPKVDDKTTKAAATADTNKATKSNKTNNTIKNQNEVKLTTTTTSNEEAPANENATKEENPDEKIAEPKSDEENNSNLCGCRPIPKSTSNNSNINSNTCCKSPSSSDIDDENFNNNLYYNKYSNRQQRPVNNNKRNFSKKNKIVTTTSSSIVIKLKMQNSDDEMNDDVNYNNINRNKRYNRHDNCNCNINEYQQLQRRKQYPKAKTDIDLEQENLWKQNRIELRHSNNCNCHHTITAKTTTTGHNTRNYNKNIQQQNLKSSLRQQRAPYNNNNNNNNSCCKCKKIGPKNSNNIPSTSEEESFRNLKYYHYNDDVNNNNINNDDDDDKHYNKQQSNDIIYRRCTIEKFHQNANGKLQLELKCMDNNDDGADNVNDDLPEKDMKNYRIEKSEKIQKCMCCFESNKKPRNFKYDTNVNMENDDDKFRPISSRTYRKDSSSAYNPDDSEDYCNCGVGIDGGNNMANRKNKDSDKYATKSAQTSFDQNTNIDIDQINNYADDDDEQNENQQNDDHQKNPYNITVAVVKPNTNNNNDDYEFENFNNKSVEKTNVQEQCCYCNSNNNNNDNNSPINNVDNKEEQVIEITIKDMKNQSPKFDEDLTDNEIPSKILRSSCGKPLANYDPTLNDINPLKFDNVYSPTDRKPSAQVYDRIGKTMPTENYLKRNELYGVASVFAPDTNAATNNNNNNNIQKDKYGMVVLNYRKILKYLKLACPSKKIKLLQAIRWRITKFDENIRQQTLRDISKNDLLGIKYCDCTTSTRTLLEDLLWPLNVVTPHPLQDCTARLLNAIVSTKSGRDYFENISIIKSLVWGEDTFTQPFYYSDRNFIEATMADNLIATMMKLSINAFQRRDMIKKGIMKWLLNHMEDVEYSGSTYHFEYMTAFLMMLLNQSNTSIYIVEQGRQLLALLARFLQIDKPICQPYIRAALITLFKNYKFCRCAKSMNYSEIILNKIQGANEPNEIKEFEAIYTYMNSATPKDYPICTNSFADEGIYLDEEIDFEDPTEETDLEGEDLLIAKFSLKKLKYANQQKITKIPHLKRSNLISDECLIPPTTQQSFTEPTLNFERIPVKGQIFSRTKYREFNQRNKYDSFNMAQQQRRTQYDQTDQYDGNYGKRGNGKNFDPALQVYQCLPTCQSKCKQLNEMKIIQQEKQKLCRCQSVNYPITDYSKKSRPRSISAPPPTANNNDPNLQQNNLPIDINIIINCQNNDKKDNVVEDEKSPEDAALSTTKTNLISEKDSKDTTDDDKTTKSNEENLITSDDKKKSNKSKYNKMGQNKKDDNIVATEAATKDTDKKNKNKDKSKQVVGNNEKNDGETDDKDLKKPKDKNLKKQNETNKNDKVENVDEVAGAVANENDAVKQLTTAEKDNPDNEKSSIEQKLTSILTSTNEINIKTKKIKLTNSNEFGILLDIPNLSIMCKEKSKDENSAPQNSENDENDTSKSYICTVLNEKTTTNQDECFDINCCRTNPNKPQQREVQQNNCTCCPAAMMDKREKLSRKKSGASSDSSQRYNINIRNFTRKSSLQQHPSAAQYQYGANTRSNSRDTTIAYVRQCRISHSSDDNDTNGNHINNADVNCKCMQTRN